MVAGHNADCMDVRANCSEEALTPKAFQSLARLYALVAMLQLVRLKEPCSGMKMRRAKISANENPFQQPPFGSPAIEPDG